jgi:FixJ family two-component response regulator
MSEETSDPAKGLRAVPDDADGALSRVRGRIRQAEALVAQLREDERTMLRHIVAGWSRAESAARLGLDPHQFEKRRAGLLAKLNASSTADAVRVGIYAGLS